MPGTKMIKTGPFLLNGSSKVHFWLISDTLAVGGCWGWQMLLFWELVNKIQMFKPPEHTRYHDSRQLSILLPLRAIYFSTFQYETPCMCHVNYLGMRKAWLLWLFCVLLISIDNSFILSIKPIHFVNSVCTIFIFWKRDLSLQTFPS